MQSQSFNLPRQDYEKVMVFFLHRYYESFKDKLGQKGTKNACQYYGILSNSYDFTVKMITVSQMQSSCKYDIF